MVDPKLLDKVGRMLKQSLVDPAQLAAMQGAAAGGAPAGIPEPPPSGMPAPPAGAPMDPATMAAMGQMGQMPPMDPATMAAMAGAMPPEAMGAMPPEAGGGAMPPEVKDAIKEAVKEAMNEASPNKEKGGDNELASRVDQLEEVVGQLVQMIQGVMGPGAPTGG